MLPRAVHFTTMLLSPGIFRPKVRLHFSHIYPSGVGLPQQGHYEHIGMGRSTTLFTRSGPPANGSTARLKRWALNGPKFAISAPSNASMP